MNEKTIGLFTGMVVYAAFGLAQSSTGQSEKIISNRNGSRNLPLEVAKMVMPVSNAYRRPVAIESHAVFDHLSIKIKEIQQYEKQMVIENKLYSVRVGDVNGNKLADEGDELVIRVKLNDGHPFGGLIRNSESYYYDYYLGDGKVDMGYDDDFKIRGDNAAGGNGEGKMNYGVLNDVYLTRLDWLMSELSSKTNAQKSNSTKR